MRSSRIKFVLFGLSLLLAVFVGACGSSTVTPTPTPSGNGGNVGNGGGTGADLTINISGFAFAPASATVRVGQSVAWKNTDSVAHTATANGAFDTGAIGPGATSASIVMSTPGTFAYKCSFHPEMVASITVTQ